MDELKSSGKPFQISKQEVWDAWVKVKDKGAPGVDGQSIAAFEAGLKNNLYRIWNRMSSGAYFPPPVRAVEIPKPHGGGTRIANLFMHYAFDLWLGREFPAVEFERYADDGVIHCASRYQARKEAIRPKPLQPAYAG